MSLLLNIDTATEVASVCVSHHGKAISERKNEHQREHASFIHAAIEGILQEIGFQLQEIDAFAVTSGPGSYTGLRVGMATAKGFCYAFSKPLITINTLEVMATAALETLVQIDEASLLCPMIDARRMEVFTAAYTVALENVFPPQPLLLGEKTFDNLMTKKEMFFFGSGSTKFKPLKAGKNAVFVEVEHSAKHLAKLAVKAFQQRNFADVSYSEPEYFKDFHSLSINTNI